MMRVIILGLTFLIGVVANQQDSPKQELTDKRLNKIQEYVDQAGKFYVDEQYQFSANKISAAQKLLERSIKEGKPELREALEKEHGRIAKAHKLIGAQGVELSELVPFPDDYGVMTQAESVTEKEDSSINDDGDAEDGEENEASEGFVSFKTSVAPILTAKCGNCHIRRSLGKYSMASFEIMMAGSPGGDTVVAGKPDDSLLYSLIENGEMPKRDTFDEKDLQLIKKWIEEGAKFDGKDKKAPINSDRDGRRGR